MWSCCQTPSETTCEWDTTHPLLVPHPIPQGNNRETHPVALCDWNRIYFYPCLAKRSEPTLAHPKYTHIKYLHVGLGLGVGCKKV